MSSNKPSLIFWGTIGSKGLKFVVTCPKKAKFCRLLGKFEKLRREMHFRDLIFQRDIAQVHISIVVGNFFQEKELEALEWLTHSRDLNPIENVWTFLNSNYENEQFFWGENVEVLKMCNEIDSHVLRKLYENSTGYRRTDLFIRNIHLIRTD